MLEITQLKEATDSGVREINALLPQLRENPAEHAGTLSELEAITNDKNVALIVAQDDGRIVGMATLYMMTKFSKRTGDVEDVVVDDSYRGQGLGQKIMELLIETARKNNVKTLALTSRPARVAAHKLYEKLGFKKKETDVFKLVL